MHCITLIFIKNRRLNVKLQTLITDTTFHLNSLSITLAFRAFEILFIPI